MVDPIVHIAQFNCATTVVTWANCLFFFGVGLIFAVLAIIITMFTVDRTWFLPSSIRRSKFQTA